MVEYNVILNGRGGGKTFTIMYEIHDLILAGRRADVLVVFPDTNYLSWWRSMWEGLFPGVPLPRYIPISRGERARGLQVAKIYVEDIDRYEDGIYDPRLKTFWLCLRSALGDEEVIFTSSWIVLNQRSHNAETSKRMAMEAAAKRLRHRRAMLELNEAIVVNRMLNYIERNKDAT